MACKIDIKEAFDTLRWDFLLKVLRVAGYVDNFVTVALAFAQHCHRFPKVLWGSWIWENYIPIKRSLICWRLLHNRVPTFDHLRRQGFIASSYCCFCFSAEETVDHIFWQCSGIKPIWREFLQWFNFQDFSYDIHSFLVAACNRDTSSQVRTFWKIGIITLIRVIWTLRNACIFKDKVFYAKHLLQIVCVAFKEAAPPPVIINVYWWPPVSHWIKVNTDGSPLGSPGKIVAGGVFIDKFGWVRGCFHYNGGTGFAFETELLAIIMAIPIAHSRGWFDLWVESDSTYIVDLLHTRSTLVPWRFIASWNKILVLLQDFNIQISHIYREGNVPADIMASENMTEGWWPHKVEEIKKAVRLDMATNSHVRLKVK
ncbi:uncharacterized protein LOC130994122 [Salvia miltiorrhiza]|uniref:uncharacterized protein LOC130994122 n=1 Tax=Salvia miltiorrhiza TaxID=226208 RepID=UPI0025AC1FFB|nr:uncharacterized protein LOC130994122 [Salvia miltiorrhiza]